MIIRVPDIFNNSVQALTNFGYDYCLTMMSSPVSDVSEEVSSSKDNLQDPVQYTFELDGCSFCLSVAPKAGWNHGFEILPKLILGLCIILLLTGLTVVILVIECQREMLQKLAITDPLTGLLNRKGFDEQLQKLIQTNPNVHCVGAQSMRECFGNDAILCRNGALFGEITLETQLCGLSQKLQAASQKPDTRRYPAF